MGQMQAGILLRVLGYVLGGDEFSAQDNGWQSCIAWVLGCVPGVVVFSFPGDWVTWGTRVPWGTLIDSGGPVQLRVLGYNLGGVEFSALGMKCKWQKWWWWRWRILGQWIRWNQVRREKTKTKKLPD